MVNAKGVTFISWFTKLASFSLFLLLWGQRQSWNQLNATNCPNFLRPDFSFMAHYCLPLKGLWTPQTNKQSFLICCNMVLGNTFLLSTSLECITWVWLKYITKLWHGENFKAVISVWMPIIGEFVGHFLSNLSLKVSDFCMMVGGNRTNHLIVWFSI